VKKNPAPYPSRFGYGCHSWVKNRPRTRIAIPRLFALFQWCMAWLTPAVYQVGLEPACHSWCRPHVGGGVRIPSTVHGIFPKRRTSGGKKEEGDLLANPRSSFHLSRANLFGPLSLHLSPLLCSDPNLHCSDGIHPFVLSPSITRRHQEAEEVDWLTSRWIQG
jgi:hypothetical protein